LEPDPYIQNVFVLNHHHDAKRTFKMDDFTYQPLGEPKLEIRLLDLLPGEGPVLCNLRTVKLSNLDEYEALSYCWGKPTPRRIIRIDGHKVAIGPNLYTALQYLRLKDRCRTLWVDAVCINQQDTLEKNNQVSIMNEIYKRSTKTVVWLGIDNFLTRRAFYVFRVLWQCRTWPERRPRVNDKWRDLQKRVKAWDWSSGQPRTNKQLLRLNWFWDRLFDEYAYDHLFKRPWFSRVWVTQELALCPSAVFVCGRDEIGYEELEFFDYAFTLIPSWADAPLSARRQWTNKLPLDALQVFIENESSLATDPRDKIYGVLSLVSEGCRDTIIDVDYSRSVEDTFIDFTKKVLTTRDGLQVLALGQGCSSKSKTSLPSWSLTWDADDRRPLYRNAFASQTSLSQIRLRATGDSKTRIVFGSDRKTLCLFGSEFDEIVVQGPLMRSTDTWFMVWKLFRTYLSWRHICDVESKDAYPSTGEPRLLAFYRLFADLESTFVGQRTAGELSAELKDFDTLLMRITTPFSWLYLGWIGVLLSVFWLGLLSMLGIARREDEARTEIPPWYFYDAINAWNRTVFRTSRQYLGLGDPTAKPGDKVFLVTGSTVPLILRQSGERWRLVGECLVHGIMSGEAYDEKNTKPVWLE
jgi:hypothetical protein